MIGMCKLELSFLNPNPNSPSPIIKYQSKLVFNKILSLFAFARLTVVGATPPRIIMSLLLLNSSVRTTISGGRFSVTVLYSFQVFYSFSYHLFNTSNDKRKSLAISLSSLKQVFLFLFVFTKWENCLLENRPKSTQKPTAPHTIKLWRRK